MSTIVPVDNKWYITRLAEKNKNLFVYEATGDKTKLYSRVCQHSNGRQPHVMTPDKYKHVRKVYGDSVFWLETPLNPDDLLAVEIASKTPGERKGFPINELIKLEKHALSMGVPLKSRGDITSLSETEPGISEDIKREIQELIKIQKTKQLWSVIRTGSNIDKPNYYMCAEYWCIYDDMPVIKKEFLGTQYRKYHNNKIVMTPGKRPNTCPFCVGEEIKNDSRPATEETVLHRKEGPYGSPRHEYIGFLDKSIHPDNISLPCCFVQPKHLGEPVYNDIIVPKKTLKVKPVRKSLKIKTKSPENKRNTLTQLENFFDKPTREDELKGLFNVSRVNKPKSVNKTVKQQRGTKKEQIKGKWETYTKPELIKLLIEHKVPYGTKGLFVRDSSHVKLVELAYKYVK